MAQPDSMDLMDTVPTGIEPSPSPQAPADSKTFGTWNENKNVFSKLNFTFIFAIKFW